MKKASFFNKKLLMYFVIAVIGAGLFFKFYRNGDDITYITEKVIRQNIQKVVNATGEVKAIELVTVGAQVSGKIEKLYVTMGQQVKEGDLIAEIDSTTQQNDVDINKAKLKSYEAQLTAAKISMKVADKQYKRMQTLQKRNAASAEDLENAQDTYETAKSKVTELESSLKETQISLSTAETNLGYTKITAPLDGTIVSIPVKQGQTINAAMDTPTIVQIADLRRMEILIEISEGELENNKPGVIVIYDVSPEKVLTVPVTGVKEIDGLNYVEFLTGDGVQRRQITTGVSDGLNIEVKNGVNSGEEVVIAKMSSAEISDKATGMRGPRRF